MSKELLDKIYGVAIDAGSGLEESIRISRGENAKSDDLFTFKSEVLKSLGKIARTVLIDSNFGPKLIQSYPENCIPMMAYEADVYHISDKDRITILPENLKISDYQKLGFKILKFFMYFAPDDDLYLNRKKLDIIKNIGDECLKNNIQFLLEPLVYDPLIKFGTPEYALLKPTLVKRAIEIFSDPKFNVNFLKVEIPVDLSFVEDFGVPQISKTKAMSYFKDAAEAARGIPLLYLSAGVSFDWFKASLIMARDADVDFSGFVCGRAIWSEAINIFGNGGLEPLKEWLDNIGCKRLNELISLVE